MRFTIHSNKLNRDFDFYAPSGGGYVRLETERRPGTLGEQICEGGGVGYGSALSCAGSERSLEVVARRWYRQHMAWQREMGFPDA
jgi:hypothetical protein